MTRPSTNRLLLAANAVLALAFIASFFVDLYPTLRPGRAEAGAQQYSWAASELGQETPFSQYREVVRSRALFSPSQGAQETAQERTLIQDYELLGTFTRGGSVKAFLRNIGTNQTKTVAVGNWVGDYEIIELTADGVVFEKAGQKFTLKR